MTTEAESGARILFARLQTEAYDVYWSAYLDHTPEFLQWYMWTDVGSDVVPRPGPASYRPPSHFMPPPHSNCIIAGARSPSATTRTGSTTTLPRAAGRPCTAARRQPAAAAHRHRPCCGAELHNAAGTTTLAVPGITAAIGNRLYLFVAADNSRGAAGVSSIGATITDASGNVWTRVSNLNRTQAARPTTASACRSSSARLRWRSPPRHGAVQSGHPGPYRSTSSG